MSDLDRVTRVRDDPTVSRPLPPARQRFVVMFPSALAEQVRDMAERERRPLTTQIQVLVERAIAAGTSIAA